MPAPSGDKLPLVEYVASIMEQMAEAAARLETRFPHWKVVSCDFTARACLKPLGGVVWADIDEPKNLPMSDIPIKMTRVPGADE